MRRSRRRSGDDFVTANVRTVRVLGIARESDGVRSPRLTIPSPGRVPLNPVARSRVGASDR